MTVGIAEAKNQLPKLIRAMEAGEEVVITRHGAPVARLARPEAEKHEIKLGWMRGKMKLLPGWDDPITEEELLGNHY